MMTILFSLFLALASTTGSSSPVIVEAANGDWHRLPPLQERGYEHLDTKVMIRLHEIASQGQCSLPGYARGRLDFRLSFAAEFDPGGSLRRIVIPKLNCPEAEGIIGGALLEMMREGDYRQTGKSPNGWYRGRFTFSFAA